LPSPDSLDNLSDSRHRAPDGPAAARSDASLGRRCCVDGGGFSIKSGHVAT
jgi:hypothetical protein